MNEPVCSVRGSRYNSNTGRRKRASFRSLGAVRATRHACELAGIALAGLIGLVFFFANGNWTAEFFFCTNWLVVLGPIVSLMTNHLNQKHC